VVTAPPGAARPCPDQVFLRRLRAERPMPGRCSESRPAAAGVGSIPRSWPAFRPYAGADSRVAVSAPAPRWGRVDPKPPRWCRTYGGLLWL